MLTAFEFGTDCSPGHCGVVPGTQEWDADTQAFFEYSVPGFNNYAYGNVTYSLAPPLPEPATAGLLGIALMILLLFTAFRRLLEH
jgi:hypothetical protein